MDDPSNVQPVSNEESPQREPAGDLVVPTEITPETPKQTETYNKADLDEYCLLLYSIYERLDIESNEVLL